MAVGRRREAPPRSGSRAAALNSIPSDCLTHFEAAEVAAYDIAKTRFACLSRGRVSMSSVLDWDFGSDLAFGLYEVAILS